MPNRFQNAAIVVTGAASGIGRETALAFAREGARVAVADIDEAGGAETVQMIEDEGKEAAFVETDVSKPEQVATLIDGAVNQWGRLDVVINNAGVGGVRAPTAAYPDDDWTRTLDVNAGGTFYGTKHALRHMMPAEHGAIVNVASVAGLVGFPGSVAYCASKHAIVGITRAASLEAAKAGVRVNAVCPVFTETAMVDDLRAHDPALGERLAAGIPLGRLGTVEEVAAAILYLCAPEGRFLTGVALPLDGGLTAA